MMSTVIIGEQGTNNNAARSRSLQALLPPFTSVTRDNTPHRQNAPLPVFEISRRSKGLAWLRGSLKFHLSTPLTGNEGSLPCLNSVIRSKHSSCLRRVVESLPKLSSNWTASPSRKLLSRVRLVSSPKSRSVQSRAEFDVPEDGTGNSAQLNSLKFCGREIPCRCQTN